MANHIALAVPDPVPDPVPVPVELLTTLPKKKGSPDKYGNGDTPLPECEAG